MLMEVGLAPILPSHCVVIPPLSLADLIGANPGSTAGGVRALDIEQAGAAFAGEARRR